jgi:hypothetical protein
MSNDRRLHVALRAMQRECRVRGGLLSAAVLAAVSGLCAVPDHANAVSLVTIESEDTTTLPSFNFITTPDIVKGDFVLSTTGSVPGSRLSPFGDNTTPYSAISSGGKGGAATYNLFGATTFSFLWGSPDIYNKVAFFSDANGKGTKLAVFSGEDLSPPASRKGFDFVVFEASKGVTLGSVELFDPSGKPAFEFSDVDPTATPLPAALPLYAAGIGLMGLLGWRRKRQQNSEMVAHA